MPATKFESVRWAAKPTTSPMIAVEASTPPATARTDGIVEQRREDADGDDGVETAAPQHAVARRGTGVERALGHAAVDDPRRDHGRQDHTRSDRDAFPVHPKVVPYGSSGFLPANPSSIPCQ